MRSWAIQKASYVSMHHVSTACVCYPVLMYVINHVVCYIFLHAEHLAALRGCGCSVCGWVSVVNIVSQGADSLSERRNDQVAQTA